MQSLLSLSGLNWPVPDYSTLCRRQLGLEVQVPYQPSAAGLHLLKRLGERVMARTFERQVNELHIRAAILNRFTELGRPQTVAVA